MERKFFARGNGLMIPLMGVCVDSAIDEIEQGGRKFCAEQTFDVCDEHGEEHALMVDVHDFSWEESWGDVEDEANKYRV